MERRGCKNGFKLVMEGVIPTSSLCVSSDSINKFCDKLTDIFDISIDWYDVDANAFIGYLEDFHATFNLPLWVTEWACQVLKLVFILFI